jgi:hypothetical protein
VAPDAEQDRHIMTQTSRERRELPVLMRWSYAGNDTSRHNRHGQPIVRSLMSSKRLPKRPSQAYDLTRVRIRQPYSNSRASTPELGAAI